MKVDRARSEQVGIWSVRIQWLTLCSQAAGEQYQADIEPLLPSSAGTMFGFCANADPSTTAQLQRSPNAKATSHTLRPPLSA